MEQKLNSAFCRNFEEIVSRFIDAIDSHKFTPNTWPETRADSARFRAEQFRAELIELTNSLRREEKE